MKIAVSGKGGVGKSTIAAALALTLAKRGERVLALDADPDANLAAALGMPPELRAKIMPISEEIALIEERTGAKVNEYGRVFKLNPDVSDVAERFAVSYEGVDVLVLGAAQKGGGGCACPESSFIKALITDIVLYKNQSLIMDMEAGIEHLGRATAQGVDVMLVVIEPGRRSIECAKSVIRMSQEIGIKKLVFVGNKITSKSDGNFINEALGYKLAAAIPYSEPVRAADMRGISALGELTEYIEQILEALMKNGND